MFPKTEILSKFTSSLQTWETCDLNDPLSVHVGAWRAYLSAGLFMTVLAALRASGAGITCWTCDGCMPASELHLVHKLQHASVTIALDAEDALKSSHPVLSLDPSRQNPD